MNYTLIFDFIIAALGLYLVFTSLRMKKTGEISTLIVNLDEISKCKDKIQFIEGIYRQVLVFGIVSLGFGVLACINDSGFFYFGKWFDIVGAVIFISAFVWFNIQMRKVKAKYFY